MVLDFHHKGIIECNVIYMEEGTNQNTLFDEGIVALSRVQTTLAFSLERGFGRTILILQVYGRGIWNI